MLVPAGEYDGRRGSKARRQAQPTKPGRGRNSEAHEPPGGQPQRSAVYPTLPRTSDNVSYVRFKGRFFRGFRPIGHTSPWAHRHRRSPRRPTGPASSCSPPLRQIASAWAVPHRAQCRDLPAGSAPSIVTDRPSKCQQGTRPSAGGAIGGRGSVPSAPLLCPRRNQAVIGVAVITSGPTAHGACAFSFRTMQAGPCEAVRSARPRSGRTGATGSNPPTTMRNQRLDVCPGNRASPVGNEGNSGVGGIGAAGSSRRLNSSMYSPITCCTSGGTSGYPFRTATAIQ